MAAAFEQSAVNGLHSALVVVAESILLLVSDAERWYADVLRHFFAADFDLPIGNESFLDGVLKCPVVRVSRDVPNGNDVAAVSLAALHEGSLVFVLPIVLAEVLGLAKHHVQLLFHESVQRTSQPDKQFRNIGVVGFEVTGWELFERGRRMLRKFLLQLSGALFLVLSVCCEWRSAFVVNEQHVHGQVARPRVAKSPHRNELVAVVGEKLVVAHAVFFVVEVGWAPRAESMDSDLCLLFLRWNSQDEHVKVNLQLVEVREELGRLKDEIDRLLLSFQLE